MLGLARVVFQLRSRKNTKGTFAINLEFVGVIIFPEVHNYGISGLHRVIVMIIISPLVGLISQTIKTMPRDSKIERQFTRQDLAIIIFIIKVRHAPWEGGSQRKSDSL